MKKYLKIASFLLALTVVGSFAGCGKEEGSEQTDKAEGNSQSVEFDNNAEVSEDYFKWDDNIIMALTESGAEQETLIIPKRCQGFNGMIFSATDNRVKAVSFESDNDVDLNGVFRNAQNLEVIKLPAGITKVADMDFWRCTSLQSITIPAGVKEIGKNAFQQDTSLTKVVLEGDVTSIAPHAFDGCESLSEVVLPDTVSTIGEYAFFNCMALKEVTLPAGLTEVGGFAFANSGLEKLTVPAETTLSMYDGTSFVQHDHDIEIFVTEGSWMDQNFETVFDGAFNKNYSK